MHMPQKYLPVSLARFKNKNSYQQEVFGERALVHVVEGDVYLIDLRRYLMLTVLALVFLFCHLHLKNISLFNEKRNTFIKYFIIC